MYATEKDRAAVAAIRRVVEGRGYPPSIRELMTLLGLTSPATAHRRLRRLALLGMIERVEGRPRAIRVIEEVENGYQTD